jgi:hypothetical protein
MAWDVSAGKKQDDGTSHCHGPKTGGVAASVPLGNPDIAEPT